MSQPLVQPVSSKWTTLAIHTVKCAHEVVQDPKWMDLSPLDYAVSGLLTSNVFLYKHKSEACDPESDGARVLPLDGLIRSLSKALVHFYPLAGRLIKSEKDLVVRSCCNDEGAVWIPKRYDGVVSDVIDEDNFQPDEILSGLSEKHLAAPTNDPSGVPALVVQVLHWLLSS
ncbi:hypothetical protein Mapa_002458 [Marchantia paleacea]|nr:hypothetical protein Mapa_002458 [Marchantia paleacea]